MAKTDINENIYRAIDTIIDARLQNVNFNSTVLCTIVDDSKAASGIFTVDNAGIKFQATSMDKSFKVNDQVYVTVPNNNFDAQKIIIGKKEDFAKLQEQWKDPFSYLDIKYKFDDESSEVTIVPTNNGVVSEKLIKRIILNNDFFDTDMTHSAYKYSYNGTWQEKMQALEMVMLDLGYSGWTLCEDGEQLDDSKIFKAILLRRNEVQDYNVFRIKTLDLDEVPLNSQLYPTYNSFGKYHYDSSIRWKDSFDQNVLDFLEDFYVYYNEKQYSPIPLTGLKNIIITADFKSDIEEKISTIISGSYYLECKLFLTDMNKNINESNAAIEVSLMMASNQDFLGDPYNYFDYFTQTILFDTSNYQNCVLNKIEFILHQNGDFNGDGDFSQTNIYVKNPKIYFGLPKQETEIGYANYESIFRTSSKYYQKLTVGGIWEIEDNLKSIPPVNTELDTDGPFDFYIKGNYYKRYLPKLYYKDSQGNYTTSSIIKVKYYDEICWIPNDSEISTHSWSNNKYRWDFENSKWVLKSNYTESDEYPAELEPYVCYLPGKQIASYFGAIEKNNTTPQVGISSSEQNIDVTLASSASNANVILEAYNNRNITLQGNEDIIINNNNKSQIKLNEDLLLIKNTNNSNGNGIKLSNNPSGNGEISLRLGYDNGQPALTIYIQKTNGEHKTLVINYDNLDRLIN